MLVRVNNCYGAGIQLIAADGTVAVREDLSSCLVQVRAWGRPN